MSSQIYALQWNDTPAGKSILYKSEIIDYCRHFGQNTPELHDFLTRFDFDEWICMELYVDYVYGKTDKKGGVGSDATAYLGIIATSFLSEEGELALRNYLGGKEKFAYPEETPSFLTFDDCPLWMIRVIEKQQQHSAGLFFMPATFWKGASLTSESAGYEKYGVNDSQSWHQWYAEGFGKNYKQNQYWRNRIGQYSPNFLDRETDTVISIGRCPIQYDRWKNRIVFYDYETAEMVYFDLSEPQTRHAVPSPIKNSNDSYFMITPEGYEFYLKDHLLVTDKDFNKLSETPFKAINSFEDEIWKVILDSKGVLVTKKETNEEKRFKYSELKMSSSTYLNTPDMLTILSNSNHSLLFFGSVLSMIDSSFKATNIDINSLFKKESPLYLNGNVQRETVVKISDTVQWFFSPQGVLEMGPDEKPELLNGKLSAITGEGVFYKAVTDDALEGIWYIAGNNRLVFTDRKLETGFVFNLSDQVSVSSEEGDLFYDLFLDAEGHLWYTLSDGRLCKINRIELEAKLKTATAYVSK